MTRIVEYHDGKLGARLARELACPTLAHEMRSFPDGETYLRIDEDVAQHDCLVVADLSRPNARILPLLLLAATLRTQGARRIELIAPYLPYMRQDRAFQPGESVSSRHFAELICCHFDTLLTVDAHLHRYRSLADVYRIPATNLSASGLLGAWIAEHIRAPVLFGPDAESRQWVEDAAKTLGCPWRVLAKSRQGDRVVEVRGTIDASLRGRTPVLIDDMISTGTTLIEGSRLLQEAGLGKACVLAVHGIFAGDSEARLRAAGIDQIVTSDSIPHASNALGLAPLLAQYLRTRSTRERQANP
ncbi:MAG: ribose-phosphate diphosphokinase [Pseudomonadales bacterium]|nr:ribose-phosphate diphosphokinase [Pseudomonadales bacterium]